MMNLSEVVELVGRWPEDKEVPRLLDEVIKTSSEDDKWKIGMLWEAVIVAASDEEDFKLISQYIHSK